MLETKFVKYLQSKPSHTKGFIFVITMATAAITLFSFWAASLRNTFIASSGNHDSSDKKVMIQKEKTNAPSLFNNLKASISDIGGSVSDSYEDLLKSFENKSDDKKKIKEIKNKETKNLKSKSEDARRVKPVTLPPQN